jgi:hypothetical protein
MRVAGQQAMNPSERPPPGGASDAASTSTPRSVGGGVHVDTGNGRGGGRRHLGGGPVLGSNSPRYGRYVVLLALVILVLITINTIETKPNGARGIEPGHTIPPFAAPLALGTLNGDVNVARYADEGTAGRTPACAVHGPGVLNVCALYRGHPLVLALFVDAGSCPRVLSEMQAIAISFPAVSFAAVAIKGERGPLLELIRKQGLTRVQVGFDSDGILAGLYKVASCPQVSFVLPGGVVQSPALLLTPSRQTLRARVAALVAASGRVAGGASK